MARKVRDGARRNAFFPTSQGLWGLAAGPGLFLRSD